MDSSIGDSCLLWVVLTYTIQGWTIFKILLNILKVVVQCRSTDRNLILPYDAVAAPMVCKAQELVDSVFRRIICMVVLDIDVVNIFQDLIGDKDRISCVVSGKILPCDCR